MAQPAAIAVESARLRYEVGADGRTLAFVDRQTGANHAVPDRPFCRVATEAGSFAATAVAPVADGFRVQFGDSGVEAVLAYRAEPDYLVIEVVRVEGPARSLTFVDLDLAAAPGDPFVATLLALDLQTEVPSIPQPGLQLRATAHRKFGLTGARAAVVGCPEADLRAALQAVVRGQDSVPKSPLGGPFAADHPQTRGSYLMDTAASLTEESVDAWARMAREMGVAQIDFHTGVNLRFGDYEPNPEHFPRGLASVRAVTDRLEAAGILAGLHTYAFFLAKDTPWVTPVPHPELAVAESFTLAAPIAADATEIEVAESTGHLSTERGFLVANSLTLRIGDELLTYGGFAKEPPWRITGLTRGAHGTVAAAHPAGAPVGHLKEIFGLFLPAPGSELFTEIVERTARAYNEGGFDMMYLDAIDGAFLVDEPADAWHYAGLFVWELARRLERPALMEMSMFTHHLWYLRSRIGAWDVPTRGLKAFIDMHAVYNQEYERCLLPTHLGWWGVRPWSGQDLARTFPDVVEYLCAKALAHGAGTSWIVGFDRDSYFASHNQQRLGRIIRRYEELRLSRRVPEEVLRRLAEPGQDFALVDAGAGALAFHPVDFDEHPVDARPESRTWTVANAYGPQPLQLRIQAALAPAPWDDPEARVLVDFADPASFTESRSREGVTSSLVAAADGAGAFTARSTCDRPDGAWTMRGRLLDPPADLSRRGLGLWVEGDGKGELLNVQLKSPSVMEGAILDHYVRIDFTGRRYVELVEPEGEAIADHDWPYCPRRGDWGRGGAGVFVGAYSSFHLHCERHRVRQVNLWYNDIPEGETVATRIGPIRSLPLRQIALIDPTVRIGAAAVTFPVRLASGHYLELDAAGACAVYDAQGELLSRVQPRGPIPRLAAGPNAVAFDSRVEGSAQPRAQVTVIARGEGMGWTAAR